METAIIAILATVCAALLYAFWHTSQAKTRLDAELKLSAERNNMETEAHRREMQASEAAHQRQMEELRNANARQVEDLRTSHREQMQQMQSALSDNFKAMAAETLDATARRQDERATQNIDAVLAPMREAFNKMTEEFRERTLAVHAERNSLRDGIAMLEKLNRQVSDETRRLSTALRGNTGFQGRWGEMVLANILESSGLEPGRWLVYQESTTTADGQRLRPDAVIHCPRGRDIIVDAKVSLTAYLRMTECADPDDASELRAEHLRSIENHLRGLSNKEYQKRLGGADAGFVLMFVPHEGAYLTAMQADSDLWQRAYDRHVVIVSPTHLVTVVRLVEQMWQTEDQTANSLAIADEATKMLDQLNDFLADLKTLGNSLDKAHASYDSSLRRLASGRGNVMRRAARLRELGVKTRKPFNEIDMPDALPETESPKLPDEQI